MKIDFDYASKKWRSNKIYLGDGTFKYKKIKCNFLKKNGELCKNKIDFSELYCYCHKK